MQVQTVEVKSVNNVFDAFSVHVSLFFKTVMKELRTPMWKKWKREYYVIHIWNIILHKEFVKLRQEVIKHFPALFNEFVGDTIETSTTDIEEVLIVETATTLVDANMTTVAPIEAQVLTEARQLEPESQSIVKLVVLHDNEPLQVTKNKQKRFSKAMTIKELKAYAVEHSIHVPGRKTKHRDIFEHIKAELNAQQA
jgi:hypothetical protein